MPYKSDKQRRFFHTDTAKKAGITPAMVKEYDTATKGKDLPESAPKKSRAKHIMESIAKAVSKK